MKNRIPFLPDWAVLRRSYAFKDIDSATAIEQTAKIYKAMQELIEDYNKFVEELNKSFEEHITLTEKDHECFKAHIDKICHDYIAVMDMHAASQDKIVDDAVQYMKENLGEGIRVVIDIMRQSGEMNEVVLHGLVDINSKLETQASAIETNTNNISANATNISNNASAISELDNELTQLDSRVVEQDNRVGSLDNLNFAEIGGDTANVVAAINAVHRRMDNELEAINESLDTIGNNLTNLSDNVYVKDNYAVLEGSVTLDANSSDNIDSDTTISYLGTRTITELNYPTGFTKDNCICLAIAIMNHYQDRWSNFTQDHVSMSARTLTGSLPRDVVLFSDNISLQITNFQTTTLAVNYKIVLLKYKD